MDPIPPAVARNGAKAFDRIVFSRFGQRMTEEAGLTCHYVPHGVDTKQLSPIPQAEARKMIGWPEDRFIVGMVAANKGNPARKALCEHMAAFAKLYAKHPDALLYLHTSAGQNGEYGGINLHEFANILGISKAVVYADQYSEIALHTDVSVSCVHSVVSRYNRFGPQAIEGCEHGVRRRCYLKKDEEAEFLESFLDVASTGEICVAGPIKEALEALLDHPVHHSTVYRMLHRNGWREIVPRPAHPEAKEEVQEAFKKTSLNS